MKEKIQALERKIDFFIQKIDTVKSRQGYSK
jgi:hypothetical protein